MSSFFLIIFIAGMTSSGSVLNSGFSVPASLFYAYIIAPILANVKHYFNKKEKKSA